MIGNMKYHSVLNWPLMEWALLRLKKPKRVAYASIFHEQYWGVVFQFPLTPPPPPSFPLPSSPLPSHPTPPLPPPLQKRLSLTQRALLFTLQQICLTWILSTWDLRISVSRRVFQTYLWETWLQRNTGNTKYKYHVRDCKISRLECSSICAGSLKYRREGLELSKWKQD